MGLAELKQKEKDFSREEIIARETAKVILESGAFQLFFGKPITFSSGIRSPMKIEADKISGSSRELQKEIFFRGRMFWF